MNDDKTELLANKSYHGGAPKLKKIKLINTPDSDALRHNLEVGNITCYYSDLSGCELPQVRGGYKKVNLNNLVYLGANMKSGLMTYTDMRKVVSTAIGRDDIVENAYFGNATPTSDIYNPGWQERESVAWAGENVANENVYLALLTKIGYNKKDNSGFYVNEDGERLSLSLVYNKGNIWRESAAKLIKTHLRAAGIKVELKALEWEEYKTYLKEGWFDLYLAEVKIGNNMDVSELVTRGGSAAWGVDYKKKKDEDKEKPSEPDGTADNALGDTSTDGTAMGDDGTAAIEPEEPPHDEFAGDTAEALKKLYSGEETTDLTAVSTAFASEMPIIPICYRSGILSYSTDINGISPSYGEVYRGIGNTTI